MAAADELEPVQIAAPPQPCKACHRRRNATSTKWLACSPEHRCAALDRAKQCAAAVLPGRDVCSAHEGKAAFTA